MLKNYHHIKKLPLFVILLLLISCSSASPTEETSQPNDQQLDYAGKKIVWVDSYHQGYEWSDGLEASIKETLADTGVELKIIRMDTKRNTSEDFGQQSGANAKAEIELFKPDVVIATDDNAQKFLVVPYLKNTETPVIFAGVNWDASIYGYPANNITGMVEVELPLQLITHLKQYAQGEKIGFITANNQTQQKITQIYNDRFFDGQMEIIWANSWTEFKEGFLKLQNEVDIVLVSNNAGINDWDETEAITFFTKNTKVPTGATYAWMTPYVLIVLGIIPQEQGQWAAETALNLLSGQSISEIPPVENKKGNLILNLDIAEQMDIVFTPSLLKNSTLYSGGE